MKQIDAGTMDPTGGSMTNAGRICGMIATIRLIVGMLTFIAFIAFGLVGAFVGHH